MLSTGSGKGCHLFGPGSLFGCWCGGSGCGWLFYHGRSLLWQVSGGNRGVCPNMMWHAVARAPLSCGGLLYKMTWQAERKSLWPLLSSPMACSSRSHMYLPCPLWNIAAWETFWASTWQMALEQAASASWTKWPLVVLAFLTTAKKSVLALKDQPRTGCLGIKSCLRTDDFGSFDWCGCLRLILAEYYAQFPNSSPSPGIYGSFGVQHIIEGSVGICPELC